MGNESEHDHGDAGGDTEFRHYQDLAGGLVAGTLKSLIQYAPHTIAVIAAALGAVGWLSSHHANVKEQADTQEVWQHSGQWHTNLLILGDVVTNQETRLLSDENEISQLRQAIQQLESRPQTTAPYRDFNYMPSASERRYEIPTNSSLYQFLGTNVIYLHGL